ncbi:MAG: hypothetical protein KGJ53_07150 [Alphaproteobacteria bacterium]|nr:hypothetical protein [Alphaproteobacteria bacterium]
MIKLLAAGLALCAQAHVDCSQFTANDFLALAAQQRMPKSAEINRAGHAAQRDAQGMCDVVRVNGVFESHHNAVGIPTAIYLYSWQASSSGPIKWGTGSICWRNSTTQVPQ